MNTLKLSLIGIAALGCYFAVASPELKLDETGLPGFVGAAAKADKDGYPRWSVVGEWRVKHPSWTDVLTLNADGTASTRDQETTAKWTLTAEGGTPLLVLRWDEYGTESLSMVGPDHFRGQIAPESFMDMRRGEEQAEEKEAGEKRE
jgi:hypothetical protein